MQDASARGAARVWPYGDRPRICVSLAAPDADGLHGRLEALDGADLIEVRLDALRPDLLTVETLPALVVDLRSASPLPVGVTLRPTWQGGAYDGPEDARRLLLAAAAGSGAAFVDVELEAAWIHDFVAGAPCPLIASHHWEGVAEDLDATVDRARRLAPAVVKLVATADSPGDAAPLLAAGMDLVEAGQAAACFCMGRAGRSSRLLSVARGGALIYAATETGQEVAPGQWSLRQLVDELHLPEWAPRVEPCGLIGDPIGHSLSPALFNAAFRSAGLDMAYIPVEGADLDDVLDLLAAADFRGVSVTMPFKRAMASRSGEQDAMVEATGAANTVLFGDPWSAHNTDGPAVVEALAAERPLDGARVAIVGAGGAAAAAAHALAAAGAGVTILNRSVERARELAEACGGRAGGVAELAEGEFDVVINATPVGMLGTGSEGETPFSVDGLGGGELVLDMVYRPRRTRLLREAAERGCCVVEGLEMFLRQAAAQYRLLTGGSGDEPLAAMRAVAEEFLREDTLEGA